MGACLRPAFSRCKTAAVQSDLLSRVSVSSWPACATVLPACRAFVSTPNLTSIVSSVSFRDPEPLPVWRLGATHVLPTAARAQDGGCFATPSSVPVSRNRLLLTVLPTVTVPLLRSKRVTDGRGWTPRGMSASPPRDKRLVSTEEGVQKLLGPMGPSPHHQGNQLIRWCLYVERR